MSRWKVVRIGDICDLLGGGTPSKKNPGFYSGSIPWVTVKDFKSDVIKDTEDHITEEAVKSSATRVVPAGTVLLVTRVGVGKVAIIGQPMAINQDVKAVVPKDARLVDNQFLAWSLTQLGDHLERVATGATVKGITLDQIRFQVISLPPLPEQRRIVDILNHANSIRRLRREALEKARAMIPALFVEMFGDPVPDNRYLIKPLSEVAEIVSGVTKGRKFNSVAPVEVPYLRVANVQAGYLDLSEIKTIHALPDEVDRLKLMPGDVLLTEGGDFDKLGRGALWQGQIENCIHQNHVFRVRVNEFDLIPQYFVNLLQTWQAKSYFLRCAKRTTNLASINMTQLRGLPVPVPPIARQEAFADRIADIQALIDQQERMAAKTDEMMNALMARFFGNGVGMEAAT